jgi:hypothetical protein
MNNMGYPEKPLSFSDKLIDCREKPGQSNPGFHSDGAFKEFWKEYKEKLRVI